MEALLREHNLPLYSLEDFTPLGQFDVLGFTLQYDLCYTNVLAMLDLAGIPLAAAERDGRHPLVIAGGPCTANPEPMARFIDLFVLGDGEETLPEVCDLWLRSETLGDRARAALGEMAGPAALCLCAAMSMRRNTTLAAGSRRCGRYGRACRSGSSRR